MELRPENCKDNSEISTYKTCPRKHFLRYVLGWTRDGTAAPLVFGGAYHAGLDRVWTQAKDLSEDDLLQSACEGFILEWQERGFSPDMSLEEQERLGARTPGVAKEMYYNYIIDRRRMLQGATLISCERPIAIPLPGITNTFLIGRLDKEINWEGRDLVLEHKTTTAYSIKAGFRSDYIDSWNSSPQVKEYQFISSAHRGHDMPVWMDLNLVHKKVHDAFKFVPVKHPDEILSEWMWDTVSWVKSIQLEEQAYRDAGELKPGMFRKNEEACFGKYGVCPFIDICRGISRPDLLDGPPLGYKEERWEPFSKLGFLDAMQQSKDEVTK